MSASLAQHIYVLAALTILCLFGFVFNGCPMTRFYLRLPMIIEANDLIFRKSIGQFYLKLKNKIKPFKWLFEGDNNTVIP